MLLTLSNKINNMKKVYTPFFCILFFSCSAKIHFVGQQHPSTDKIDIYVTESAIKKQFVIAGQGYLNLWAARLKPDKIQALAEKQALQKGADGILITDYYIPQSGHAINTVLRTDTLSKSVITTGNTTITPLTTSGYRIFFIKYQN